MFCLDVLFRVVLGFFSVVPLHFFRFGERFCDDQYDLVSFLFAVLLLTVPSCPAICKSGENVPPLPNEVGATAQTSLNHLAQSWPVGYFRPVIRA